MTCSAYSFAVPKGIDTSSAVVVVYFCSESSQEHGESKNCCIILHALNLLAFLPCRHVQFLTRTFLVYQISSRSLTITSLQDLYVHFTSRIQCYDTWFMIVQGLWILTVMAFLHVFVKDYIVFLLWRFRILAHWLLWFKKPWGNTL